MIEKKIRERENDGNRDSDRKRMREQRDAEKREEKN